VPTGGWHVVAARYPQFVPDRDRDDQLIAQQIDYYRARAREFDPSHHHPTPDLVEPLSAFRPRGRVVEIACGTGIWTAEILRHPVQDLLCIDAAPEMLEIHAARIDDARVRRERHDLFRWEPREAFDAAVFAFWLSHVPPSRSAEFWGVLRRAIAPRGRVFFIDDDHRAEPTEQLITGSSAPVVRRTLADGSEHVVIKSFHEPRRLASQLSALGWTSEVRSVGSRFLWGIARPSAISGARSDAHEPGGVLNGSTSGDERGEDVLLALGRGPRERAAEVPDSHANCLAAARRRAAHSRRTSAHRDTGTAEGGGSCTFRRASWADWAGSGEEGRRACRDLVV